MKNQEMCLYILEWAIIHHMNHSTNILICFKLFICKYVKEKVDLAKELHKIYVLFEWFPNNKD